MPTDLLRLVQWLSPAFPTGGFAYSHGMEQAIADGAVHDAASAQAWIADVLRIGAGWSDAVLLARAREGEDLRDIARALAPSAERLRETEEQGAAFAATVTALGVPVDPQPLPLAVAAASRALDLSTRQVAALFLHGFAGNLVACATRFVPLGQTQGQRVLQALHPLIDDLAERAATAPLSAIASATIAGDLSAMRHETLDVRIFKT
ncbi:urease accessory protein UreF [Falsirhodobacter sp. 20TX0035]|uniref:urease accessory protein UreF n=1 Tax=Falsirhodobacter sp. 20TX0035 TaxID=3022019 RepID=UPI00232ADA06|nr:urease accessory UreF family protein [Falsirhodobacter sp. 20TX0035]MDB6454504.1 urease accessory UreF family protein [Falsirhodobacter sp. 20TX0035]